MKPLQQKQCITIPMGRTTFVLMILVGFCCLFGCIPAPSDSPSLTTWERLPQLPLAYSYQTGARYLNQAAVFYSPDNQTQLLYLYPLDSDTKQTAWDLFVLPLDRHSYTVFMIQERIYLVGGVTWDHRAPPTVHSRLLERSYFPPWVENQALPDTRVDHTVVQYEDRLFVLGGQLEDEMITQTIYYTELTAEGSITSWHTAGVEMPSALYHTQGYIVDKRLYLFGGYTYLGASARIYSIPFNQDKSLSQWSSHSTTLPDGLQDFGMYYWNRTFYFVGGRIGDAPSRRIYYIHLNEDGKFESFQWVESLPQAIRYPLIAGIDNQICVSGGWIDEQINRAAYRIQIP